MLNLNKIQNLSSHCPTATSEDGMTRSLATEIFPPAASFQKPDALQFSDFFSFFDISKVMATGTAGANEQDQRKWVKICVCVSVYITLMFSAAGKC